MVKVAINGLGRIGRLLLRHNMLNPLPGVEIVAVNDLLDVQQILYSLQYDSVHGRFPLPVRHQGQKLQLGQVAIELYSQANIKDLPWSSSGIDVVLDCTGICKDKARAEQYLSHGVKKVVISAPMLQADLSLVLGVNDQDYDINQHHIISNTSCTTNSLAPPLKVLLDHFGINSVMVTTVHAYTISQRVVDGAAAKDPINGRAAAINMIPTSTGSDVATTLVLPTLKDRLQALAVRVPVANGSLTDISAELTKEVTVAQLNAAFKDAALSSMQGILAYSEDALVSSDIIGDSHSAIVHAKSTRVVQGKMIKLHVWYDNEYAYARRLLETAAIVMGQSLIR